jgi:hypothetical protein
MIKTLIKYIVAETAVNTFFSNVFNNFTNINICKFEKGQTYSRIVTMYTEGGIKYKSVYYNCIVRNTNNTEYILISYGGVHTVQFQSDAEYTTHYGTSGRTIIDINDMARIVI